MNGPEAAIRFVNLSQFVLEKDLGAVLDEIVREVEATNARIVVVESFRTVVRKAQSEAAAGKTSEMELQGIARSRDTGEPWEDTFPLRGKDGAYRWFLSRALPIRDQSGNVVRWFGTNTDVTAQR